MKVNFKNKTCIICGKKATHQLKSVNCYYCKEHYFIVVNSLIENILMPYKKDSETRKLIEDYFEIVKKEFDLSDIEFLKFRPTLNLIFRTFNSIPRTKKEFKEVLEIIEDSPYLYTTKEKHKKVVKVLASKLGITV